MARLAHLSMMLIVLAGKRRDIPADTAAAAGAAAVNGQGGLAAYSLGAAASSGPFSRKAWYSIMASS